jgi:hypothetical protein
VVTGASGGPSYAELARTVDELRQENARLRGLLGLDTRAGDGHSQAWAPTLLAEVRERPAVDASASEAEKAGVLRSLFGARSDVYATRWENTTTDFDKGTWALDALAYLDACHANGVPAVLERSRSGNGAHVWVFCNQRTWLDGLATV